MAEFTPLFCSRIFLAPLAMKDAEALFRYRTHPLVEQFQSLRFRDLRDAERFIAELPKDFGERGTWFQLGIFKIDKGELIGDLGIHFLETGEEAEIGYTISPSSQRQGFAWEVTCATLDYLFLHQGLQSLVASTDPQNVRSRKLLQKLGFHLMEEVLLEDEAVEEIVYRLRRSEWRGHSAQSDAN